MPNRTEVERQLRKAASGVGNYGEWIDAVQQARDSGWTEQEVNTVLNRTKATQLLWFVLGAVALIFGIGAIGEWLKLP